MSTYYIVSINYSYPLSKGTQGLARERNPHAAKYNTL